MKFSQTTGSTTSELLVCLLLVCSVDKIVKRLGPQNAKAAKEAIEQGDLKKAAEINA